MQLNAQIKNASRFKGGIYYKFRLIELPDPFEFNPSVHSLIFC